MGFFDRLSRLVRANANAAVSSMEDPVKILDQSVADMQSDLVKLRQAVAMAIASQKRLRNQADQAETQSRTWYERAELALKKNEEDLAREALTRRKTFQETATSLNKQVKAQEAQVETLKKSLVALEGKIAEARTKKDMLKARAQAAQAQQQLQSAVNGMGTNSAMAAFERMEDKVQSMEASSQAAAELAGADLESQFAALESGSDVDDELASLRQQLQGGPEAVALPQADDKVQPVKVADDVCVGVEIKPFREAKGSQKSCPQGIEREQPLARLLIERWPQHHTVPTLLKLVEHLAASVCRKPRFVDQEQMPVNDTGAVGVNIGRKAGQQLIDPAVGL